MEGINLSDTVLVQILVLIGVGITVIGGGLIVNYRKFRELNVTATQLQNDYKLKSQELEQRAKAAVEEYKIALWDKLEEQREKLYKDVDEKREARILELREQVHHWRNESHIAHGKLAILQGEKMELERKVNSLEVEKVLSDQKILNLIYQIEVLEKRLIEEDLDDPIVTKQGQARGDN